MEGFRQVAALIHDASDYRAVFAEADPKSIKTTYRKLVRSVHPDRVSGDYQAEAESAMRRLEELRADASSALTSGSFGLPVSNLILESSTMRHQCDAKLNRFFDVTNGYRSHTQADNLAVDTIVKIVRQPCDNDLMLAEARSLQLLAKTDPRHVNFYPELVDSFMVVDERKRLRVNVISRLDGFVNLEEVVERYPGGISPLDMAWIWRRVLWALGGAHEAGVLHGALVPTHIMIQPALHGVVLVDWCYSLQRSGDNYPPLQALVGAIRDWYPEDILNRQAPTEALDLSFAARSMQFVMARQTVPSAIRRYFEEISSGASPESAYQLGLRFDSILEHLGAPYYPRVFRPLNW